jgi:hypothetical protein
VEDAVNTLGWIACVALFGPIVLTVWAIALRFLLSEFRRLGRHEE